MQRIRRLAAVVGVTALAGAFVSGPASADNAEVYVGSAAARGLHISLAHPLNGSKVGATLGSAESSVESALKATATGTGQLDQLSTTRTAAADAAKVVDDPAAGCAMALADQLPAEAAALNALISLGLACGDASATVANNLPAANAEGSIAGLKVDGQSVTQILNLDTTLIGDTLSTVLGTVCEKLAAACPATTTVEDLVQSILKTRTLDAAVGKSTSAVVTEAGKVTSTATASGAVVNILPMPKVGGLPTTAPLATIEVGAAKATAAYDRAKGTATATPEPALVKVKFNSAMHALGVQDQTITPPLSGTVPTTVNLDLPSPLTSQIIVAGGHVEDGPNGSKTAVADGVKLRLLMGLGESKAGALDGGITIELAHAEAAAGGKPEVVTPTTTPNPDVCTTACETPRVAKELPRTGGTPWIPFAGAGVLAAAVLFRRAGLKAKADLG